MHYGGFDDNGVDPIPTCQPCLEQRNLTGTESTMPASPMIAQAAAIPIDDGRICLVNSSSGRGWVIPKGHIEPDQTARDTALQEAWEEAGLRGVLNRAPVAPINTKRTAQLTVSLFFSCR